MRSLRKIGVIRNIRTATVLVVGTLGVFAGSFLVATGLRNAVNSNATLSDITAILLGGLLISLLVTVIFCLLAFHAFAFFESTTLLQAIRLGEAMRMLHAKTHHESLAALKYYRIDVFRAKKPLGEGIEKNIRCKLIATFLSPWFFRSDQNAAFGSNNHCCDFDHIQKIIAANKVKWCGDEKDLSKTSVDVTAMERRIADILEEKKDINAKYTAAAGREGRLKKQLEETKNHMAVLVELANKVTNEVRPPRNITEDSIKAKYLAIGKIHGIDNVPGAYMDIFRQNMPKEIINQGGAPKQDFADKET